MHAFWNRVHNGRSRSSEVVDFGTNWKRICNLMLVISIVTLVLIYSTPKWGVHSVTVSHGGGIGAAASWRTHCYFVWAWLSVITAWLSAEQLYTVTAAQHSHKAIWSALAGRPAASCLPDSQYTLCHVYFVDLKITTAVTLNGCRAPTEWVLAQLQEPLPNSIN